MTHCHKCGEEIEPDDKFCSNCGAVAKKKEIIKHEPKTKTTVDFRLLIFLLFLIAIVAFFFVIEVAPKKTFTAAEDAKEIAPPPQVIPQEIQPPKLDLRLFVAPVPLQYIRSDIPDIPVSDPDFVAEESEKYPENESTVIVKLRKYLRYHENNTDPKYGFPILEKIKPSDYYDAYGEAHLYGYTSDINGSVNCTVSEFYGNILSGRQKVSMSMKQWLFKHRDFHVEFFFEKDKKPSRVRYEVYCQHESGVSVFNTHTLNLVYK